jgi:LysR family nitrogen assimilation transcriptional regulator
MTIAIQLIEDFMDLKQLESFVRVAELGSFTRAAGIQQVAQPLLSRHVRQLEVELHQSLLARNGRGVTLTEAGRVLLEHARGILHQVAVAREELEAVRGALSGRVSIGLPPSLSKLITVPLTFEFRQRMPKAQLSLTEGFSLLMVESLRAGRLDLAVLYNPAPSPDLEMSLLHEEALILIAGRQASSKSKTEALPSTVTLNALADLPLIAPSRPNAFRLLIDSEMQRIQRKPRIVLEIDGLNAILELVREGLGYAVLPAYTLSNFPDTQAFTTHRIQQPQIMSQLMLVWSARRPMTSTHKASLELARELVARTVNTQAAEPPGQKP